MLSPFNSAQSDESGDSKPEIPRPPNYDRTLRLLFSEDPEEDETLQPISSGMSIDVNEPKVAGEGEFLIIEKKIGAVLEWLNPIPFVPARLLHFARHERVLRSLGLWDFAHMDFNRSIRVDLLAQLVGTYNASTLDSYVNGHRVMVSKAKLGLALSLPVRKRGKVGLGYSEDSLEFLENFLLNWLVLHGGDESVLPNEVKHWLEKIRSGRVEKMDWAGLVWVMVEKELAQGERLRDCYYASHLQRLMKWQHEELFLEDDKACKMDARLEGSDESGVKMGYVEVGGAINDCAVGIQNIEVMQEKCGNEKDVMDDSETAMDNEKCKEYEEVAIGLDDRKCVDEEMVESEKEGGDGFRASTAGNTLGGLHNLVELMEGSKVVFGYASVDDSTNAYIEYTASSPSLVYNVKKGPEEEGGNDEHGDVKISGTVNDELGEGCAVGIPSVVLLQGEYRDEKEDEEGAEMTMDADKFKEYDMGARGLEDRKYVDEEMVEGEDNEDGGRIGKLIETMEGGDVALSLQGQFSSANHSSLREHTNGGIDINHIASSLSLSQHVEKGVALAEHDDGISVGPLQEAKPIGFEQIHEMMERARTLYAEKESVLKQKVASEQILMDVIQTRDALIEHFHKTKFNEIKTKDIMIYRLKCELDLKKSVLDDYKKALKETQREFDNYISRAKLCEKPPCKDAGQIGLVLSSSDLAKIEEEEDERCVGHFKECI